MALASAYLVTTKKPDARFAPRTNFGNSKLPMVQSCGALASPGQYEFRGPAVVGAKKDESQKLWSFEIVLARANGL